MVFHYAIHYEKRRGLPNRILQEKEKRKSLKDIYCYEFKGRHANVDFLDLIDYKMYSKNILVTYHLHCFYKIR